MRSDNASIRPIRVGFWSVGCRRPAARLTGRRGRSKRGGLVWPIRIEAGQDPLVAAWYWATTLAGMRPRALTAMPWSLAHTRISPLRSRPAAPRPGPAALACARLAGVLDEGRELAAERGGVFFAQVDLVLGAANREPDRLRRGPPSRSSSSATVIFCAIPASQAAIGYQHRTRSTAMAEGTRDTASHRRRSTRAAERDQPSSARTRAARRACPLPTTIALSSPLGTVPSRARARAIWPARLERTGRQA
jgi:hypothetical protein